MNKSLRDSSVRRIFDLFVLKLSKRAGYFPAHIDYKRIQIKPFAPSSMILPRV